MKDKERLMKYVVLMKASNPEQTCDDIYSKLGSPATKRVMDPEKGYYVIKETEEREYA